MKPNLRTVDVAVRQLAACVDEQECSSALADLASALGHADVTPNAIFTPDQPQATRSLALAASLQLVARNSIAMRDDALRQSAWQLLDVAATEVYEAARITPKSQTYEKDVQLRMTLESSSRPYQELLRNLKKAAGLSQARTRFMRWLNDPVAAHALRPLMGDEFAVTKLRSVWETAASYLEADGADAQRAYQDAEEVIRTYLEDLHHAGSPTALEVLKPLAEQIQTVLLDHFESMPFASPAQLVVDATPKKYPLHEDGRVINVELRISNRGEGPADAVVVRPVDSSGNIVPETDELYLGRLTGDSVIILIPCRVALADSIALLRVDVQWSNYDGSIGHAARDLTLSTQRTDVDWERLRFEDPYSLEPVDSEDQLSGRDELLSQLYALVSRPQMGSIVLYGQKRVGKTSIAKTMASRIGRDRSHTYAVAYLESGDFVDPDPTKTVANLGRRMCEEMASLDERLQPIPIPSFDGALTPVSDYLRAAQAAAPSLRVLFILDEFDELPVELYRRGPLADSLFLAIRTQSGKADVGFCLVGGEKMEHVMSAQGDALNKFRPLRVDYFDKAEHWDDFADLVRNPVREWLEVSDEALGEIYAQTAGNPFFTKLICGELYRMMVERRDAHVAASEARDAAASALRSAAANSFQHFWEDGIVDVGGRVELVSIRRRHILIALGRLIQQGRERSRENIANEAGRFGISPAESAMELDEFVRRRVLEVDRGNYSCKVQLFERWLADRGLDELVVQVLDPDAVTAFVQEDAGLYVRPEEIVSLTARWGLYRGIRIGEERVRAWLDQFSTPREKRLMYRVLAAVDFYDPDRIRVAMSEAHGIVRRGLRFQLEEGRRKSSEILLSYLGSGNKSGAACARLYASENNVYVANVVEPRNISFAVQEIGAQVVVFVDDFIGSGESAANALEELRPELSGLEVPVYVIAVSAIDNGLQAVERRCDEMALDARIRACTTLQFSERIFAERSGVFKDEAERLEAREVAYRYGRKLVKAAPLGYADGQCTVVFDQSIPNNDLPILWKRSRSWEPLFSRL